MKRSAILLVLVGLIVSIAQPLLHATEGQEAYTAPPTVIAKAHAQVRIIAQPSVHPLLQKSEPVVEAEIGVIKTQSPVHLALTEETEEEKIELPLLPIVNQPDIRPEDRKLLNEVLHWMPKRSYAHLQHIIVRYDSAAPRGQATSDTIILRGDMPRAEMIAVFIHELGHTLDLGALRGTDVAGESNYPDGPMATYNDDPSRKFYAISWKSPTAKRVNAKSADFVSGYAEDKDIFEDMAESIVYYALHNNAFRERAKENDVLAQKLEWLETYIFDSGFTPVSSAEWNRKIVWDITKMEHNLML